MKLHLALYSIISNQSIIIVTLRNIAQQTLIDFKCTIGGSFLKFELEFENLI